MPRVAVCRHRMITGFDGDNTPPRDYRVLSIEEALRREYDSDAHMVAYWLPRSNVQWRINKAGLPHCAPSPRLDVLIADLDNPEHANWTTRGIESAIDTYASLDILHRAGVYLTAHGARVVQPIYPSLSPAEYEVYLPEWHDMLRAEGLDPDPLCRDWTRHYRMPHVRRDGRFSRALYVDTSRMVAIERPEIIVPEPLSVRPRVRHHSGGQAWDGAAPDAWASVVQPVAQAIAPLGGIWHTLYLSLSGALLSSGIPAVHIPGLVGAISAATGRDDRTVSRVDGARSTVRRHQGGLPILGMRALRREWPAVASAVQRSVAAPQMMTMIERAPPGVTIISAECGLGKTHAAITVAMRRSGEGLATGICVPTHQLGRQIRAVLTGRGVDSQRLYGPLSVRDTEGAPVCPHHATGAVLARGGQRLQVVICPTCELYESCSIRRGVEGDADALITIAPHAMIRRVRAEVGTGGLLVIDEPPLPLTTRSLCIEDIEEVRRMSSAIVRGWYLGMEPALDAGVRLLVGKPCTGAAIDLLEGVAEEGRSPGVFARSAPYPGDVQAGPPPVCAWAVARAQDEPRYARRLGAVSSLLGYLHDVLVAQRYVLATVEGGQCHLTGARPEILDVYAGGAPAVVVLDATARVSLPMYRSILGYAPHHHHWEADDGAPIHRTHAYTEQASRRYWLPGGRPAARCASWEEAVRDLVAWVHGRRVRSLGLITYLALEDELVCAVGAETGIVVRGGHYGAMRGLNTMAQLDAVATLGDPWPRVTEVDREAEYLGVRSWPRMMAHASAELEQAHGRLRCVHRTVPGHAYHGGRCIPSGSGWQK